MNRRRVLRKNKPLKSLLRCKYVYKLSLWVLTVLAHSLKVNNFFVLRKSLFLGQCLIIFELERLYISVSMWAGERCGLLYNWLF